METVEVRALPGLAPSDLVAMHRRERVETAVRVVDGRYVEEPAGWVVPDWDDAERTSVAERTVGVLAAGGAAWGAYTGDLLVGFASVDVDPVGGDPAVLALDMLHISAPWRGRGLARVLFDVAARYVIERGGRSLYVSASRSARTVAVYRAFGAIPADPPDPTWLAREPVDVHLVVPLMPVAAAG